MIIEVFYPELPPNPGASSLRGEIFLKTIISKKKNIDLINIYSTNKENAFDNPKIRHFFFKLFSQNNKNSFLVRIIKEISLGIFLSTKFVFKSKIDRIFLISLPPYLSSLIMCLILRIRGFDYVIDVRDAYPQMYSSAGLIKKDGAIYNFFLMMNKIIFKKAKYIISATDGIQNGIHENTNNKNLITIFNGFHTFLTDIRTEKHEKFSVCFHGILANMQDIESLASLIKSFDENETIDFYIIGYGPKEGLIKKLKAKKNVFFLGKLSHEDTIYQISKCHIGLCLRTNEEVSQKSFPVKVWEYIGLKIPSIITPISEAGEYVEDREIGFQYKAGEVESIKKKIIEFKNNKFLYDKTVDNLSMIETSFSREKQANKIINIF